MSNIGRSQSKFIFDLFPLLLALRSRYNCCNMARWGGYRNVHLWTFDVQKWTFRWWNTTIFMAGEAHFQALLFWHKIGA